MTNLAYLNKLNDAEMTSFKYMQLNISYKCPSMTMVAKFNSWIFL